MIYFEEEWFQWLPKHHNRYDIFWIKFEYIGLSDINVERKEEWEETKIIMIGEHERRMVCVGGERPACQAALWSNMDPPWVVLSDDQRYWHDDDYWSYLKPP